MIAVAIDDEQSGLDVIRLHASKVPFLNLEAEFVDVFKALEYLQKKKVDLIFLDIKMPDISGIEFYNSLNQKPLLIFTTAYTEFAVKSFEMDAVDYLLKPFSFIRFFKSCNKAYELFTTRNSINSSDFIFVKEGSEQFKIKFEEILLLEAAGNYVNFFLKDRKILSRLTFMEAINILPSNKFVRVHRSFIVAVNKIDKIDKHQLTINKIRIPLGKVYKKDLEEIIRLRKL